MRVEGSKNEQNLLKTRITRNRPKGPQKQMPEESASHHVMDPMERETGQPHCPHDPPHVEKPDRCQILDYISIEFPTVAFLGCAGSGCIENTENHARNDPFSAKYDLSLIHI